MDCMSSSTTTESGLDETEGKPLDSRTPHPETLVKTCLLLAL
jgi:hypothetical protein